MNTSLYHFDQREIENRIFTVRDVQVMLDSHLAEMYSVETKVLNQAVKRNVERFPESFCFQLTEVEFSNLRSQIVTSSDLRFQYGTSSTEHGGRRYLPYVFTEQGVAMLSGVLRSEFAVQVSIQIMTAFVEMRKLMSTYSGLFQRLSDVEKKQLLTDEKFDLVFKALESRSILPESGIFFEGQVFDAYLFVSELIKSAKLSLVLIDNYIDETVFTLFTKRKIGVTVTFYTKTITKQLLLDARKHNEQYEAIEIKEFKQSHDRFMIVDNRDIYHFGASLKDLGKKWFAFSKFEKRSS